ncbi:MAG: hypothetical protein JOY71_08200 [Acetobacteraceae bacterium]|nr:hypothetical protein [Acetobacteraceae bacterium]
MNHGTADIREFAKHFFEQPPDGKFAVTSSSMQNGHGYAEWVMTGTDVGMFKTNKTLRSAWRLGRAGLTGEDQTGDRLLGHGDAHETAWRVAERPQ